MYEHTVAQSYSNLYGELHSDPSILTPGSGISRGYLNLTSSYAICTIITKIIHLFAIKLFTLLNYIYHGITIS
jgi:hypothetical protein